jgi:peroxiredoxin
VSGRSHDSRIGENAPFAGDLTTVNQQSRPESIEGVRGGAATAARHDPGESAGHAARPAGEAAVPAARPPHAAGRPSPQEPASLVPSQGWHVTHAFYSFDRAALAGFSEPTRQAARRAFVEALQAAADPAREGSPRRFQAWIVAGHKADFALVAMDPCPLSVDAVHQRLLAGPLGPAIRPEWSFVGLTEVSEYVPSVEQYAERLVAEGETAGSPAYEAKVQAYAAREPAMRKGRLEPEFPPWPSACFYPMNKKRKVGENWFTLPFAERSRLMAEHARSGMSFAGKVSQLITVSVGLDDWEWGVTLWARRPDFLKEIVYTMRFDEASARYAEFGPFYTGYVATPDRILEHCGLMARGAAAAAPPPRP